MRTLLFSLVLFAPTVLFSQQKEIQRKGGLEEKGLMLVLDEPGGGIIFDGLDFDPSQSWAWTFWYDHDTTSGEFALAGWVDTSSFKAKELLYVNEQNELRTSLDGEVVLVNSQLTHGWNNFIIRNTIGEGLEVMLNHRKVLEAEAVSAVGSQYEFTLGIGQRDGGVSGITGNIDQVAFYDDAEDPGYLASASFVQIYTGDLIAFYQFNEAAGDHLDMVSCLGSRVFGSTSRQPSTADVGRGNSAYSGQFEPGLRFYNNNGLEILSIDGLEHISMVEPHYDPMTLEGIEAGEPWVDHRLIVSEHDYEPGNIGMTYNLIFGGLTVESTNLSEYKLYHREVSETGRPWSLLKDSAISVNTFSGWVTFGPVQDYGQFLLVKECTMEIANVTLSADTLCEGETLTIQLDGQIDGEGSWALYDDCCSSDALEEQESDTAVFSFIPDRGTYYAKGDGCSSTDWYQIDFAYSENPEVDAGEDIYLCDGDPVELIAFGAETYEWENGVINGESFVPVVSDTISVVGTNEFGCSSTDEVYVHVDVCTSISELESDWSVYPNPASGNVYLDGLEAGVVTLRNAEGQVVLSEDIHVEHSVVDVSSFNPGLYFLEWSDNVQVKTSVITIQ